MSMETASSPADVLSALRLWRDGLINLTRTNRALNFRHTKTGSVAIEEPSLHEIFEGLRAGKQWRFVGQPDEDDLFAEGYRPLHLHTMRCRRPEKEIGPVLRNLARRANAEFLDRGLSVMYVALGMLHWQDPEERKPNASPILLIPVRFVPVGAKDIPPIVVGDDDPTVNPALTLRMNNFGITLPAVDDLESFSVETLLDQVRAVVAGKKDWKVTEEAVLAPFSFQKEAMYRDLLDHEEMVVDHPIVQALANQDPLTQDRSLLFEGMRPEDVDNDAPPESTPLVLDADSSQRACVAAALAGKSFVMDGPPGTGKSQTIANMIGALLHAGKTVLFVSEKAAALEVVRNRLAHAGLENYLLELHSHKASRKEVTAQLAHALDNEPVPPVGMGESDRREAADKRRRLNAYADAMNRVRQPLGRNLHDVLGEIAQLEHVPAAPTPDVAPVDLSHEILLEVDDACSRLQRAWTPASQGTSFLWRDVIERGPLDTRLYQAQTARDELLGVAMHNTGLISAFDLHAISDLADLATLLDRCEDRPEGVEDSWLARVDFSTVQQALEELRGHVSEVNQARAAIEEQAGVPWHALPDPATLPEPVWETQLRPAPIHLETISAAAATGVADRFERETTMLQERLDSLQGLARRLELPDVVTMDDADRTLEITSAGFARHRPLESWMTEEGLRFARDAATRLKVMIHDLGTAEAAARRTFTDEALTQPLEALHERFTNVHRGLRKLFGDYRRDKKTVAAFKAEMVSLEDAIADLGSAIEWAKKASDLTAWESTLAGLLGSYYSGRETNFPALDEALDLAQRILDITPSSSLRAVTAHVTSASHEAAALESLIGSMRADLDQWRSTLASPPALAARPELLLGPISEAIRWLKEHMTPLRSAAERVGAVDRATGRQLTLSSAVELLTLRQAAVAAHAALASESDRLEHLLGTGYAGMETDLGRLQGALDWAQSVRSLRFGDDRPLTEQQVKALQTAIPTGNLRAAFDRWNLAARSIVDSFGPSRSWELESELNDFDTAESFLAALREESSGQEEWFAYTEAREDLARHHLDPAVGFCIKQRVAPEQVGQVVRRAVLRAWADHVIAGDDALRPLGAHDRTALVEKYRELDLRLIPAATSDIIRSVNARRPPAVDVGEPAKIRREGMKKSRHIPVRDLIRQTRTTTLAIKPCFMMSPLAVSQYLPPDMTFDVVIFDEASQVTPGDAINCIYRGRALITAGDDKQLPPTSFFDRMADGEEDLDTDVTDFQSILELAKGSGAFRNLGLRWHYRSRHENLIAFSNVRFYEGNLVTYPGAHSEGPDVGVDLVFASGTYRRGTTRDNPIEAQKVVERITHHFDTRPDTTLGVVTFSVAQADSIQSALDRAVEERPDLARHLEGDRLDGFFIKSLESVQGDERDVMIFSIGYGPDETGKVTANFGALNPGKGWRRLNVAITRARQRVEIVTSVRAGSVPDSANENIRHLVAYLDYAERGMDALALNIGPSGMDAESPFEESVIDAIRAMGYVVEPQVGTAGYRLDIGVRHPGHPGVFAIGIECDGYMYHSSPAARDRDRLREQVLRGLGWRLHRIWGTAWYRHRAEEAERLRQAIEAAIAAPVTGRLSGWHENFERPTVDVAQVERVEIPSWVTPYRVATVPPLPYWVDVSDPSARWDMVAGVQALAREEGPVHLDLAFQRFREAWNIGRVGAKIRENVLAAIRHAEVDFVDNFIDLPDRLEMVVRSPDGLYGQRTAAQVHEGEILAAFNGFLRDAGAMSHEELTAATARVFGWNRRGQDIQARLDDVLRRAVSSAALDLQSGTVRLVTR